MTTQHHLNFSELDKRLQELALLDFSYFCTLTGVDKNKAVVCLERAKGKSFRQIAHKLHIAKSTIYDISKNCPPKSDG